MYYSGFVDTRLTILTHLVHVTNMRFAKVEITTGEKVEITGGDHNTPYAVRAKGLEVDSEVNTGVCCLHHWIGLDCHLYNKRLITIFFDRRCSPARGVRRA